jgi:hypothetical protein
MPKEVVGTDDGFINVIGAPCGTFVIIGKDRIETRTLRGIEVEEGWRKLSAREVLGHSGDVPILKESDGKQSVMDLK